MSTITGMDLVGFSSRRSKELVAFYRDVLGLKPTLNDEDGTAAEFELSDGSTLGIWDPRDEKMYHPGAAIMFSVPDAKVAVEEFRKRGAQIADVIETPVCFLAPGQDPAGNAIVIHQRKNK
ncbi:MAG: VOC family protein [Candidatus Eremiobacteraeota bacterium]|nr:VOC family protein [Candidatus Eremiobacteraeota bacterium]